MVSVQRGNVVLDVAEINLQHYLDKGYSLLDDHGNVIKAAVPTDMATLKKAFIDHTKMIDELKAEITLLKEELANLKAKKSSKAK